MAALGPNDTWVSRMSPLGLIGHSKFNGCRELAGVLWENKSELAYAWNLLNHGVCDGCSLGISGLRENVLDRVHLCMTRLRLLKYNTMGSLDVTLLRDVERLRKLSPDRLRSLGRLPFPMLRRRNARGFVRLSWEEAVEWVARSVRAAAPNETGFFATPNRLTNEVYYVLQKLARTLGTNNVDLCSRRCDRTAITGLKNTLGIGASTCSLNDFIGADLVVLFGTDLTHNHLTAKYAHFAKEQGTRIVVIEPVQQGEPDLRRLDSVKISRNNLTNDVFPVRAGGNIAFINGVLKSLIGANLLDGDFVSRHTSGLAELKASLEKQPWELVERRSGLERAAIERFARICSSVKTAVFVYNLHPPQHESGVANVEALANLALARGMLGREKCGILMVGGDSGEHGGAECGALPDAFPGDFAVNEENARRFSNLWRHPVSSVPGLKVPQYIEAAHRGEIKFLYSVGANLLEAIPNRIFSSEAIARVPFRVHQDIVLDGSMFLDAQEMVLLLPEQTRYEQRSGGTCTSSERCIRFTPEVPGHRIGESLPSWQILTLVGRKTMSNGELLFPFTDTQSIREEMARVMPIYQGIEKLNKEGDQVQWGGPYLYKDGFANMANYRARFSALEAPDLGESPLNLNSRAGAASTAKRSTARLR
jgi:molybdopterin-dependent oxidoreductase alpha subunit